MVTFPFLFLILLIWKNHYVSLHESCYSLSSRWVGSDSLWPHVLAALQDSLSFTVSWSLLKLMFTESVMPSNHLILCHHLHFLPSVFPESWFLPMSQLFPSGGQSIGESASVLPKNIQSLFPLGLIGLISLLSKGLLESSPAPQFENNSLALSPLYGPTFTSIHDYWKNHSFD